MMTEPAPEPTTDAPAPARTAPQRVWTATDWKRRTQRFTIEEDAELVEYCRRHNQPINDAVRMFVMDGIERAAQLERQARK